MSTSTFVSRRDSQDRWQAALKRADEKGVKLFQIETSGVYIATSGTRMLVAYQTDGVSCECQAGQHGDPVCVHRARCWQVMGMLTLDEIAPATVPCSFCRGTGQFWTEGDFSASACGCCGGRGWFYEVVTDRLSDNIVEFPRIDSPRPAA